MKVVSGDLIPADYLIVCDKKTKKVINNVVSIDPFNDTVDVVESDSDGNETVTTYPQKVIIKVDLKRFLTKKQEDIELRRKTNEFITTLNKYDDKVRIVKEGVVE